MFSIMEDMDPFQVTRGITPPWKVFAPKFNSKKKCLDIQIHSPQRSIVACPEYNNEKLEVYDTQEKNWRHLNFFQYKTYLTANMPHIKCGNCGIHPGNISWTRSSGGCTLRFEAMIITPAKSMSAKTISEFVNPQDVHSLRVLHHYITGSMDIDDHSDITNIGMDKTSGKRDHNHIHLFVDTDCPQIFFAIAGKDASTVEHLGQDLVDHDGNPEAMGKTNL